MSDFADKITKPLRTFIEPQLEQLNISARSISCGIIGTVSPEIGKGYVWAADLDGDCLISAHHLVLNKPKALEEHPTPYSCICSASAATVQASKELSIDHPRPLENLCTFSSEGGCVSCTLEAQIPYDSISISYTPSFFKKLEARYPGEFRDLPERMNNLQAAMLPDELKNLLRTLEPSRATQTGSTLYFQAKVFGAISLLSPYAVSDATHKSTQDLVEDIKNYLRTNYSRHITLETLSETFYVSRSKMCAAFQESTQCSIASYLRSYRIAQACDLLGNTNLSMAEIGCLVGYPRASSFSEAFLREVGTTPRAWRRALK